LHFRDLAETSRQEVGAVIGEENLMPFIPDDIMFEAVSGDGKELRVLTSYATFCQNEGQEPDLARLAATVHLPPDTTQDILARLAIKGWLERVKERAE